MNVQRIHTLLDQLEEALGFATSYTECMSKDEFLADPRTQQAVAMNLIVIGEAVSRLETQFPAFLAGFPEVPWKAMKGMRNRIAHGYFELDMEIVFDTARKNLPELLASLPALRGAVDTKDRK